MPDLGKLRYVIEADDRRFNSTMNRVQRRLTSLRGLAASAIGGAGVAGAAGVGAASSLDTLAKTARASGVSPGFLEGLRFAGTRQAGIGASTVDSNLLQFTKRLGRLQGAEPQGELFEVLKKQNRRGLFERLRAAPNPEVALGIMADAIGSADPAKASALSDAAAFSGRGALLFQGGRAGLRGAMARLPNPATDEQTRQAEAFEDARAELSAFGSGAARDAGAYFLPQMTQLLEWMNEALQKMAGDSTRSLP